MVAFGEPAGLVAVLNRLCDRLAGVTGVPRSHVFPFQGRAVDLMKKTSPPAERFLAVSARGLPVSAGVRGGGAAHTGFDARVEVAACLRNGLDAEKADFARLADAAAGLVRLVEGVVRAASVWPADRDGASVLREPARLLPEGPQFDPEAPPAGWCWCRVPVECKFRFDATAA